jgi:hypothetical protein
MAERLSVSNWMNRRRVAGCWSFQDADVARQA